MKNILIIGLGRFGKHIAMQLNQMGHEIMAVDLNEERVEKVLPFVTNAQIGAIGIFRSPAVTLSHSLIGTLSKSAQ